MTWGQEIRANQMNFAPAAAMFEVAHSVDIAVLRTVREFREVVAGAEPLGSSCVSVAACSLTLNYGAGKHQQPRTDER